MAMLLTSVSTRSEPKSCVRGGPEVPSPEEGTDTLAGFGSVGIFSVWQPLAG
jgi:hypothetical protein